jgi:hypothetical protein
VLATGVPANLKVGRRPGSFDLRSTPGPSTLSALRAASHALYASPPKRCPVSWVGVATKRLASTYRLYNCCAIRCNKLVRICSQCDRGNTFCEKCSKEARLAAGRRRSNKYQATQKGRRKHAARQSRWRRIRRLLAMPGYAGVLVRARCRVKRRRRRRCQWGHHHRPSHRRPCAKKLPRQRTVCHRARRPQERCSRLADHSRTRGRRAHLHRQPASCHRRRCRPTRCRRVRCVRTADKSLKVTHGGWLSKELCRSVPGSTPRQKETPDAHQTRRIQQPSQGPINRCSFCGRVLPPYARLHTWRGSG